MCLQNDEKEKKEMEENYSKEDELILNKQTLTFVLLEMAISDPLKRKPLRWEMLLRQRRMWLIQPKG